MQDGLVPVGGGKSQNGEIIITDMSCRGIVVSARTRNGTQSDDLQLQGVRIATMHRVKGMEYAYVYIPFLKSDYMPSQRDLVKYEDESSKQEFIIQEANLLSVAMTRAKRYVWMSFSGEPSRFIVEIEDGK